MSHLIIGVNHHSLTVSLVVLPLSLVLLPRGVSERPLAVLQSRLKVPLVGFARLEAVLALAVLPVVAPLALVEVSVLVLELSGPMTLPVNKVALVAVTFRVREGSLASLQYVRKYSLVTKIVP